MITQDQMSENVAVSVLTILNISYFRMNVTVLTCHGENGVPNLIDSPEYDSVELIILCKFLMTYSLNYTMKFCYILVTSLTHVGLQRSSVCHNMS